MLSVWGAGQDGAFFEEIDEGRADGAPVIKGKFSEKVYMCVCVCVCMLCVYIYECNVSVCSLRDTQETLFSR